MTTELSPCLQYLHHSAILMIKQVPCPETKDEERQLDQSELKEQLTIQTANLFQLLLTQKRRFPLDNLLKRPTKLAKPNSSEFRNYEPAPLQS